jgi:hypothetical protein
MPKSATATLQPWNYKPKAKCWGRQCKKIKMSLEPWRCWSKTSNQDFSSLYYFEKIKYIYFLSIVSNSVPQQETFLIDSAPVIFSRQIIPFFYFIDTWGAHQKEPWISPNFNSTLKHLYLNANFYQILCYILGILRWIVYDCNTRGSCKQVGEISFKWMNLIIMIQVQ